MLKVKESVRAAIATTILNMERPFSISDLFNYCRENLSIYNEELILDVLEELCDIGAVDYSEIYDDCWAYKLAFSK